MLAAHHVVGAAVGFARNHRHLGHRRLAVGVEQLGPLSDDPAVLLCHAGQKPRHVHKRHQRDVEAVAEAHEPRPLGRAINVQHACQHGRLLRHDPHRAPVHPGEAGHDVLRPALLHLQKVAIVHDVPDHGPHVVGPIGLLRHDGIQLAVHPLRRIAGGDDGRIVQVVRGQEAEQPAGEVQTVRLRCR